MAGIVRVAVDGQDGIVLAQNTGLRFVDVDTDLALVVVGENRDGQHGTNATRAIPGSRAGFIAVELSESTEIPEGVHVQVMQFHSREEPPASVEVPAQRDVLFTAIGGLGEPGHQGGNGQAGMDGVDGEPATRESDARAGTDAGNGGDAGAGTNGADGGDGGEVLIYVDEDDTHLLFAAHWDVRGGLPGEAGRHGEPGRGGRGGNGGAEHRWDELVGYTYSCTSNCIGQRQENAAAPLERALTRTKNNTLALMAPIRAQVVQGGNLAAVIAEAARRYGAMRYQRVDPGSCHCSGGSGNCVGCLSTPIHKTFERVHGLNGRDGTPGTAITTPLLPGTAGNEGSATIVVRYHDNTEQHYSSRYRLELLAFDVEDENGDGVFEPGEHLFIKRIRIRNNGGMPSPKRQIPISILPSRWFAPVASNQSQTYLPPSIPAGVSVTLEGSIKVAIRRSDEPPAPGTRFFEQDVLAVKAIMPWLNRELPLFEFSRSVDIQYPIELRGFDFLAALAQGSTNRVTWEIYNKSAKPLGSTSHSSRAVEVDISFPPEHGSVLSSTDEWLNTSLQEVESLAATTASTLQQTLRVHPDAQSYTHVMLQIDLYLSFPLQESVTEPGAPSEICLVQRNFLRIQISPHHTFNPSAAYLLVTNPQTKRHRVQALQSFINNELKMNMDQWNIGLYGGLQYRAEEGELSPSNVMSTYQGRTIIFDGDRFEFFKPGERSITHFLDVRALSEASLNGTSCLFLGCLNDGACIGLITSLLNPIPCRLSHVLEHVKESATFSSESEMLKSIIQTKLVGSPSFTVYTIPVRARWYQLGKPRGKAEAKRLANYLRQNLPQERFLVAASETEAFCSNSHELISGESEQAYREPCVEDSSQHGNLVVFHGSPHQVSMIATEQQSLMSNNAAVQPSNAANEENRDPPPTMTSLNYFEAFVIVKSLPVLRRVDTLWINDIGGPMARQSACSENAYNAIYLSLLIDISYEIRTFLHKATWPNKISLPKKASDSERWMRLHIPTLATLLQHPQANKPDTLPRQIVELLQYTVASCRAQKKRHIVRAALMPTGQRRDQLRKFLVHKIDSLLSQKTFSKRDISKFHSEAKDLHSLLHSNKRNTHNVITGLASEWTRTSEHTFTHRQKSGAQIVPTTTHCTQLQWEAEWSKIEASTARITAETDNARRNLGKMILDTESPDVRVELLASTPV